MMLRKSALASSDESLALPLVPIPFQTNSGPMSENSQLNALSVLHRLCPPSRKLLLLSLLKMLSTRKRPSSDAARSR